LGVRSEGTVMPFILRTTHRKQILLLKGNTIWFWVRFGTIHAVNYWTHGITVLLL